MRLAEPDLPDSETLRSSDVAWLFSAGIFAMFFMGLVFLAILSRGFVTLPYSMHTSSVDRAIYWVALVGSLIALIWSVKTMKPKDNWMTLTQEGFTVHTFRTEEFFSWSDIEQFGIRQERKHHTVIFTFSGSGNRQPPRGARMLGFDGELRNTYGMQNTELCDYLKRWHERAARRVVS